MITFKQIAIARENWLRASKELSFEIITPILLKTNGIAKKGFAYLPEYGSPNGIVVELITAPDYKADNHIVKWAKLKNCFYSFINIEELLIYDQSYFRELLEDWKKFKSN